MTTALLVAWFAIAITLIVIATGCLLWLGARLARVPDVTLARALWVAVLSGAPAAIIQIAIFVNHWEARAPLMALVLVLVGLVATWLIIGWGFHTSVGRAILAWLPTVASLAVAVAVALVMKLATELYAIPTNGMAPTLVGDHFEATCPLCSGRMIVPTHGDPAQFSFDQPALAICQKCLQAERVSVRRQDVLPGDRIAVMKFLQPRRWDIVVHKYPAEPDTVFAERVVGLPGEEVAIRNGEVLINGQVASKPAEIAALRYVADPINEHRAEWGPVRLADDEYFVLGDFSRSSLDSRGWTQGAPGHPPFAVPRDYIVGVVTHIYLPAARWRVFR